MGAVLGIAAWGRTQEKVAGTASNYIPPSPTSASGSFNTPYTGGLLSGGVTNASYQSQNFEPTPSVSYPTHTPPVQSYATVDPEPSFGAVSATPGGRRPVTPNFNA
jgi:hypothetical protein